jgi:TPR repeat protein
MANDDVFLEKAWAEMRKERPDLRKAFALLEKSADNLNPEALYAIGTWYLYGRHVNKNPKVAVQYFMKSSEGNNCHAYFDLAVCYEKGVGLKRDLKQAFLNYLKSSLLGDRKAFNEVGRCYYYGIGINKNVEIGKIWLSHAK